MLVRDVWNAPQAARGAVVALGNFDGLHLGHQAVLAECKRVAKAQGRKCAVLTFEPHPRRFFNPAAAPLRLMSFQEKAAKLKELGIDVLYVARFNATLSKLTAQEFIARILIQGLGAAHIITGEDFVFGQGRGGSRATLEQALAQGLFGYSWVEAQGDGEKISSTRIRTLLAQGKPDAAAALLGHPYALCGHVMRGDGRGPGLGFPTANIRPLRRFPPKFGIYAIRAHWRGRSFAGVASFGIRPMFALPEPLLEAHLFNFDENLYGTKISIEFLRYLRPEQQFATAAELTLQMQKDAAIARETVKP